MVLCFATNNLNKLIEVQKLLGEKFEVKGLKDIGCDEDIAETGSTLEENSAIKADFVAEKYGFDCFADDTGLEVEALGGEPGVYSARYSGPEADSQRNINLLLTNLQDVENRKARFRTVITLVQQENKIQFEGIVNGQITKEMSGSQGFGYDPIFVPEGFDTTFAEMPIDLKNSISHRGIAVSKLVSYLKSSQND